MINWRGSDENVGNASEWVGGESGKGEQDKFLQVIIFSF